MRLKFPVSRHLSLAALGWLISLNANVFSQTSPEEDAIVNAVAEGRYTKAITLSENNPKNSEIIQVSRWIAFYRRGNRHLEEGKIKEAIADYNQYATLCPSKGRRLPERGMAHYYAGEFERGRKDFESTLAEKAKRDPAFNDDGDNYRDIEEAIWHYLCSVRRTGGSIEKAQKSFIGSGTDPRIPMKEIHALFTGRGNVENIITAVNSGEPSEEERRKRLFYAHFYLGLYFEVRGEKEKSAKHIRLAAVDYKLDQGMGFIAQVHAKLREIPLVGQ